MDVTGKLHVKFDTMQVSDKFTKREFVLEISKNPSYPQYISFQLTQDKCSSLDMFECGMTVNISFNLRGGSWISPQGETKYFNTLEAWRILPATADAAIEHQVTAAHVEAKNGFNGQTTPNVAAANLNAGEDETGNGLPF